MITREELVSTRMWANISLNWRRGKGRKIVPVFEEKAIF